MITSVPYNKEHDLQYNTTCSSSTVEPIYVYEASKDLNYTYNSDKDLNTTATMPVNMAPLENTEIWICPECHCVNPIFHDICSHCNYIKCNC